MLQEEAISSFALYDIQGGPKSKPLPNCEKPVSNRIKVFQWD